MADNMTDLVAQAQRLLERAQAGKLTNREAFVLGQLAAAEGAEDRQKAVKERAAEVIRDRFPQAAS